MILTGGIAFMLAANAALLRLGLFPLQRVTRAMTTTDLLRLIGAEVSLGPGPQGGTEARLDVPVPNGSNGSK